MYCYRPDVLDELSSHGVRPTSSTHPAFVRDYLSDLYRYEIRKLRARLLRGEIAKADYAGHVIQLRLRYPLLSIPVELWVEDVRTG